MRISVCHCLNCKKRSGSAFAAQARWPDAQVTIKGGYKEWQLTGDSGSTATFRFCPECGSDIAYVIDSWPGVTAVPIGAFADPDFPAPGFSAYENRKHHWVEIVGDGVDHDSTPSSVRQPWKGLA